MGARLLAVTVLCLAASAGCSQRTTPAAAPGNATSPTTSAATAAAASPAPTDPGVGGTVANSAVAPAEGAPQIATEPSGVHLEYHVYGQGEPAVFLIHGWATDANYWHEQLGPLKSRYTVVTLDLAGHGASTRSRTDWSMGAYGDDVAAVAARITNRRIILVGHSMGATVALEAAARIGPRVIGIIAVDALKSIGTPPLSPAQIEERVAPFRSDFIGQTRSYVSDSLFPKGADPIFTQKVAYDMSLEPADIAIASLQSLLGLDMAPLLKNLHLPIMAINSDLTPTDLARIRKSVPDFTVDVMPHSSHFMMMDAAQRFNPLLLKDIAGLEQRVAPDHAR